MRVKGEGVSLGNCKQVAWWGLVANSACFQGSLVGMVNCVTLLTGDKLSAVKTSESPFWERDLKYSNKKYTGLCFLLVSEGVRVL